MLCSFGFLSLYFFVLRLSPLDPPFTAVRPKPFAGPLWDFFHDLAFSSASLYAFRVSASEKNHDAHSFPSLGASEGRKPFRISQLCISSLNFVGMISLSMSLHFHHGVSLLMDHASVALLFSSIHSFPACWE